MDGAVADSFDDASRYLVEVVRQVPQAAWSGPGLGTWTVLELIGHANRAHTTVEEYLLRPQPPAMPGSDYFSEEAITRRGQEAVLALGPVPSAAITTASERVRSLIRSTDPDATLAGPAGSTTLAKYLPSRITELTIHGMDLSRALEINVPVPSSALREGLSFVAQRSLARDPEAVLLALSGRAPLPERYSVF